MSKLQNISLSLKNSHSNAPSHLRRGATTLLLGAAITATLATVAKKYYYEKKAKELTQERTLRSMG
jgi:hypothetical protein